MAPSMSHIAMLYILIRRRRKRLRGRSLWVHPILQKRKKCGEFHHLFQELRSDPARFIRYCRLGPEAFDELLERAHPALERHSIREPLSPEGRLALTLR